MVTKRAPISESRQRYSDGFSCRSEIGSRIGFIEWCMVGDKTIIVLISLALPVVALAALWLVIGWWRRKRRQSRLAKAFARARQVRESGSGLQGKPYSLYGESSWSDDSRPNG
jgi:uncharacterized iron-regulated membrane protein